jgi:hypothetical protein
VAKVQNPKKYKSVNYPILGDRLTLPTNMEPAEVMGYVIPKQFRAFIMVRESEVSLRHWSVEFLIEIGEQGTPKVLEVTPRGLSDQDQLWIQDERYYFKKEHDSVTPRQLEILYKHYRRFVVASLQIAIQVHTYKGDGTSHSWTVFSKSRNIPTQTLIAFANEMVNRTVKTLTPEFLKKIEREHFEETRRVKLTGEKLKVNKNLSDKYLVSVKSWLVKAKEISVKETGKTKPKRVVKSGKAKSR